MHKSQGFGSTGKRGEYVEYFEHLKGVSAEKSLFEGIDFSWNRIQSGSKLQLKLNELINQFDHDNPANSVRTLLELRSMISKLNDDFWKEKKMTQIDEVLRQCLGLFAEVSTLSSSKTKGDTCSFNIEIINRSTQVVKFRNLEILETDYSKNYNEELPFNQVINIKNKWVISKTTKISQPYWLVNPSNLGGSVVDDQLLIGQPESLPSAHFKLTFEVDEVMISYLRPLIFKWNDPVKGEQKKNWVVTPKVTANLDQDVKIFTPLKKQKVTINLRSHSKNQSGSIELKTPRGWNVTGSNLFQFKLADEEQKIIFEITPESDAETGFAEVYINGRLAKGFRPIAYDHISSQLWFPDAKMKLVSLDLNIPYKKVGYLMGAGDKVGDALLNLGYELDFLDPEKLDEATLSSYDVILTGVRFFNVNEKASQLTPMLLRFVKQGGNLIVQYNTSYRLKTKSFFPYPLKISRDRVTQEDAPVTFLQPDHVVLNQPNKMTKSDFDDWVQERGLYFPDGWSKEYQAILSWSDSGEQPKKGGLLIAPYGRGNYVYTGIFFF